ncbi:MAG: hypothetical protein RI928_2457, partial [Pseudomonadota bacterium]
AKASAAIRNGTYDIMDESLLG